MERHTQRGGRDEDQAVNEVRLPQGEVERDAPAERVPEHQGVFDPQVRGDRRDVVGELHDVRVLCLERRREGESWQIDDVHRPPKAAKRPDLRSERAPIRR